MTHRNVIDMAKQLSKLNDLEQKIECLINPIEHMKYKINYIKDKLSGQIDEKFEHLIDEYKQSNPPPNVSKGFVNTELYQKMLKDEISLAQLEKRNRFDDEQLFNNYEVQRYKHDYIQKYKAEILIFNQQLDDWTKTLNLWEKENIKPKKDKYVLELVEIYFGHDKIINTPHFSKLVGL